MSYEQKKSSSSSIFYILGLLALLGLSGYLWFSNTNLKTELNSQNKLYSDLQTVHTELDNEYSVALENIESLRDDSAELNEMIARQTKELAAQKKKINNLIWKSRELGKAQEEIAALNNTVSGYLAEIGRLKEENTQLAVANTSLRKEKDVLTQDLTKQKEVSSNLSKEKELLTEEKDKLDQQKQVLDTKVDRASAIKLNSLTVEGRQNRGDGSKGQSRTRKLDFLRTCILTETNTIVKSGPQEIFIRIVDPQGLTVTRNDGVTGGILVNKVSGEQLRYTFEGSIDYENNEHEECFDWEPDHRLAKGVYLIEAYHRDYQIGKGSFKLK